MTQSRTRRFPPPTISRPDLLVDGSDALFRLTIYRFVQAAGRLAECRQGFGRHMGLTSNQYLVLMGVAYQQKSHGITIAALATHLGLAAPHVTTEARRLMEAGLLAKRANESDRRSVLLSLTSEGEVAVEEISVVLRQINGFLFDDVSREDLEALLRISEKLVQNSRRALAELQLTLSVKEASAPQSENAGT